MMRKERDGVRLSAPLRAGLERRSLLEREFPPDGVDGRLRDGRQRAVDFRAFPEVHAVDGRLEDVLQLPGEQKRFACLGKYK